MVNYNYNVPFYALLLLFLFKSCDNVFENYLIFPCFLNQDCSFFFLNFYYLYFILGVNALFIPTFWGHFYFGPYISILPLLVLNPINACYFSPFRHSTNRKS